MPKKNKGALKRELMKTNPAATSKRPYIQWWGAFKLPPYLSPNLPMAKPRKRVSKPTKIIDAKGILVKIELRTSELLKTEQFKQQKPNKLTRHIFRKLGISAPFLPSPRRFYNLLLLSEPGIDKASRSSGLEKNT